MNRLTLFVAAMSGLGWQPSIGDPTFYGWFTVLGYLGAAWASWWVHRAEATASADAKRRPLFWGLLAVTMLLLGVNKQFDLQTLVTVVGRKMARDQGWYVRRHEYQELFVISVAVAGFIGLTGCGWLIRHDLRRRWIALLGVSLLFVFIVLRASSFHHVDQLLFHRAVGSRQINRLLELGGIAVVVWVRDVRCTRRATHQGFAVLESGMAGYSIFMPDEAGAGAIDAR